jgi:hypothetical protein
MSIYVAKSIRDAQIKVGAKQAISGNNPNNCNMQKQNYLSIA